MRVGKGDIIEYTGQFAGFWPGTCRQGHQNSLLKVDLKVGPCMILRCASVGSYPPRHCADYHAFELIDANGNIGWTTLAYFAKDECDEWTFEDREPSVLWPQRMLTPDEAFDMKVTDE